MEDHHQSINQQQQTKVPAEDFTASRNSRGHVLQYYVVVVNDRTSERRCDARLVPITENMDDLAHPHPPLPPPPPPLHVQGLVIVEANDYFDRLCAPVHLADFPGQPFSVGILGVFYRHADGSVSPIGPSGTSCNGRQLMRAAQKHCEEYAPKGRQWTKLASQLEIRRRAMASAVSACPWLVLNHVLPNSTCYMCRCSECNALVDVQHKSNLVGRDRHKNCAGGTVAQEEVVKFRCGRPYPKRLLPPPPPMLASAGSSATIGTSVAAAAAAAAAAGASAAAAPSPPPNVEPPNIELDVENDDDLDDDNVLPDFEPTTEVVDGKYVFSRNVRLTRHPTRNTFGLELQSPGEALRTNSIGCLVKAVLTSCTAPTGSVQPGDRVLSVNGTTTLEWTYHQIVSFIKETNPDVLVLSLRRELPEAEVAAAKAAKVSPKPKTGTRAAEGAGGTGAKESGQSSAEGSGETKKKEAKKLLDDADGKSLTSTKTTPDVQSNVAGLATTKAPPPAAGAAAAAAPLSSSSFIAPAEDGSEQQPPSSALDETSELKPKKRRGRPPTSKKKKRETKKEADDIAAAKDGDTPPVEKEGPKTKKRRKKKGAGGASTSSGVGSDPVIIDIAGGFRAGDAKPDLTFTSEEGKGETDVDRVVKATIGVQASNLSEPDRPELGSPRRIKFVFISAPMGEGRVAAEIVLNDVKIGSIFAEFVCKSANFVEKCEHTGREFPDLELVASELFREAGQLQCEELQGYRNEWEPKNRSLEEAYYLQIKYIFIQETEFDTEEEGSDLVAHVLHRFLRHPRINRWKIVGYKAIHDVGEFYFPADKTWKHSGSNPEEVIKERWAEWETQKNTQIGADARPFVRVGFQEIGAESSDHKGILFLTKNMFLPETEILSHAQAVERKLRSDAPVDVEEYRRLKLQTEFLGVILKEDDELDSRRFNSQTSLHRAPETYDTDGKVGEKLMPQIEDFIAKGADINESHILHAAAHRHYLGLFKPLIEKGADVNAFDNNSDDCGCQYRKKNRNQCRSKPSDNLGPQVLVQR